MTYSFWIYIYSFDSGNSSNRIEYRNLEGEDDVSNGSMYGIVEMRQYRLVIVIMIKLFNIQEYGYHQI